MTMVKVAMTMRCRSSLTPLQPQINQPEKGKPNRMSTNMTVLDGTTLPSHQPAGTTSPDVESPQVKRTDLGEAGAYLVPPSLLTIDLSRNSRFEEPDAKKIKELAASFADQGQLQPIKVVQADKSWW
jgi:hypothetical protein